MALDITTQHVTAAAAEVSPSHMVEPHPDGDAIMARCDERRTGGSPSEEDAVVCVCACAVVAGCRPVKAMGLEEQVTWGVQCTVAAARRGEC